MGMGEIRSHGLEGIMVGRERPNKGLIARPDAEFAQSANETHEMSDAQGLRETPLSLHRIGLRPFSLLTASSYLTLFGRSRQPVCSPLRFLARLLLCGLSIGRRVAHQHEFCQVFPVYEAFYPCHTAFPPVRLPPMNTTKARRTQQTAILVWCGDSNGPLEDLSPTSRPRSL